MDDDGRKKKSGRQSFRFIGCEDGCVVGDERHHIASLNYPTAAARRFLYVVFHARKASSSADDSVRRGDDFPLLLECATSLCESALAATRILSRLIVFPPRAFVECLLFIGIILTSSLQIYHMQECHSVAFAMRRVMLR
ncbi:MAG: hypothetical protein ACR2LC_00645 [Pyrinomonadaceae bacterium]